MSAPDTPAEQAEETITIQSAVTRRRPDVVCVAITQEEFLTLCEGDTGETRSKRNMFLGLFWTALFALVGLLATIPWDVVAQRHEKLPYIFAIAVGVLVAVSGTACVIYWRPATEQGKPSHYVRTKERLEVAFGCTDAPPTCPRNPTSSA